MSKDFCCLTNTRLLWLSSQNRHMSSNTFALEQDPVVHDPAVCICCLDTEQKLHYCLNLFAVGKKVLPKHKLERSSNLKTPVLYREH